ncbi:MAG: hypothetical protein K0S24_2674 [Sphingobacterium sp.]|jgi:hypothetical protein|nr:hypothetical protein [Sphingobacterium sp.]
MKRLSVKIARFLLAVSLLTTTVAVKLHAQDLKPLKGTWLNLPYQDVRNKYMNPAHINCLAPAFWKTKIKEYAQMGLSHLVLMAVANDGKAFYPSTFMSAAYPTGQQSPVEAIMEAADQYGMHVFMSCGWAKNQDDNIRDPAIKALQQRIMEETASLFATKKSFYGWYLPVEDSMEPILSDEAVHAANTLSAVAKKLTPNKKVMISPYGICHAALDDPKFAQQIKKLNVDIIAYQDEVGCVREPMPLPRVRENFKKLGKIHEGTGIEFWSNIESFTWEKEDNSRESALIPAAFPRYLSQLVAASLAGTKEIISFSVYGIIDDVNSTMPIGQPTASAQAFVDFMDWKARKGRWPLLEATFKSHVLHDAIGSSVKIEGNNSIGAVQRKLTDGKFGKEHSNDLNWLDFGNEKMSVVLDLKKQLPITSLAARFLHYRPAGVSLPPTVHFYVSADGKHFDRMHTVTIPASKNDQHDCWIDIAWTGEMKAKGRYVKVVADQNSTFRIFCDEILINSNF